MSNDERLWWSILADAEVLSEVANNQGDGELAIRYHIVAARARIALRDKCGINLDTYFEKAREQVMLMAEEEAAKDRAERARIDEALKAMDRIDELLKAHK